MASLGAPLRRDPFGSETRSFSPSHAKGTSTHPSASGTSGGEAMDVSQPQASPMGPPSPVGDRTGEQQHGQTDPAPTHNGGAPPTGAAAAAQQPKIVQTAFIHKLYKYVSSFHACRHTLADTCKACWKIRAFNI